MEDLEVLATKLKHWRIEHPRGPYPKDIWEEIKKLAEHHPIFIISQTLGIRVSYLQQKLSRDFKSLSFAPVNTTSFPAPVSIEFADHKGRAMMLHFHADLQQLTQMIVALLGDPA